MYYITIYRENTIYIAIYIETNLRAKRKEEERFSYIEKYNKIYIEKTTNYLWGKKKREKRYISKYIIVYLYFPYRKAYISNIKQE